MKPSYPKRILTKRQKWLRKKFTAQDKGGDIWRAWLTVDNQSFMLETIDDPESKGKIGREYVGWRRDMMAVALDNLINQWEDL